jgi:hypothetical protein
MMRTRVKLAGSICPVPSANRHNTELAANAESDSSKKANVFKSIVGIQPQK